MQIVIGIKDTVYEGILNADKAGGNWGNDLLGILCNAVANGTPLPKGHGRIGDLDVARGKIKGYQDLIRNIGKLTPDKASDLILLGRCVELIDEVDSIIEADKAESEGL